MLSFVNFRAAKYQIKETVLMWFVSPLGNVSSFITIKFRPKSYLYKSEKCKNGYTLVKDSCCTW